MYEPIHEILVLIALARWEDTAGLSIYVVVSIFDACMHYMGLHATKPVFRVSNKARIKPVSPATETSKDNEILLVGSLHTALPKSDYQGH